MILEIRERFGGLFEIEAAARQGIEFMVVLRKRGALPPPPPAPAPSIPARAKAKAQRGWSKLRS